MKKFLLGLLAIALLLVVAFLGVFGPVFMGNAAMANVELGPRVSQVKDGYVNLFILELGSPGVALVDCGNDPTGQVLLDALKAKHREPKDVKAIFLTHGHPDHTAGCHLFPGADIYAFPGDVKLAAGEERGKGPLPRMMDGPKEKTIRVNHTLHDGEAIHLGENTVKAYLVPGHTAGSAAFLVDGILLMGDSANARSDGKTLKPAPWVFSDDPAQNKAELAKLHARIKSEGASVKTLVFAHSGPVDGLDALLTAH